MIQIGLVIDRIFSDLLACSAVTASNCRIKPDITIAQIPDIQDTQLCQKYCNTVYGTVCQYFVHDVAYEDCYILNTDELDFCYKKAGSPLTNITLCETSFDDHNEEISCLVSNQSHSIITFTDY